MDKNKSQTFILSVDDFGQKICTSQSEPQKKYVLDDEGNMTEYQPETTIRAINLESQTFTEDNSSGSSLLTETNEAVHLEDDPATLGIMSSLDEVSTFEENLMKELDSDFMKMVPNPESQTISQHMEITEPIKKLRVLLENRLGVNLKSYNLALQGQIIRDENMNLVEQCVQRVGLVQIHIQLEPSLKCINIVDVLEPAEGYTQKEDKSEKKQEPEIKKPDKNKGQYAQWQVDLNYKREQERLKIPTDPMEWSSVHVRHWVQWAVRQFNLTNIKLSDWSMTGKELYDMTIYDFQKIVPNDPGDVFWTHLELLRKMKLVATTREEPVEEKLPKILRPKVSLKKEAQNMNYATTVRCFDVTTYSPSGNRSGNNGQIQLWQFLLELLTSKEYSSIIQWIGKEGEFKLNHPDVVAQLWGERKNKPTMNYEKLSRALRYYYDGDMISKVSGKRFVYKFVCDLKQLVGYSAIELANLVKYENPMGDVENVKKEVSNRKGES